MARLRTRLAKLTRPDAAGLTLRERLFSRLDLAQAGCFAWISGAGGSGKTSLVSSWLEQRGHAAVWYRVDASDRDPATLFHYLGIAAAEHTPRRQPLPHFTPEYLPSLGDFTRRYFREFFSRLHLPCVVVFDNCHEAANSGFEDIIAWALNEVPDGVTVIGVSRAQPGKPFARRMLDSRTVQVTSEDLRLDGSDARAIAKASGQSDASVQVLLARVDGWAAGFVLLLRARANAVGTSDRSVDAQGAIFAYFASEILASADGRIRQLLLRTAMLPTVSPSLAERLTGFAESGALLADLHRNHFFTERRSRVGDEPTYEYHPLFREFLVEQARGELGVEALAALYRQAAAALDAAGSTEAAIGLWIVAKEWEPLGASICAQAPLLMRHGRWQTLRGWLDALPDERIAGNPWLLYWRGACGCMGDPAAGRVDFEAAFRQFQSAGDPLGSLLACAGVLEAGYLQFGDQKPSLPWIDIIDGLLAKCPPLPPEIEVRVIHGLTGAWFARPGHPMLARWAARAAELLRTLPDTGGKAGLMSFAVGHYVWAGDFVTSDAIVNYVDVDSRHIRDDPLSAIMFYCMKSGVAWQNAEHERSYAHIDAARRIAADYGVRVLDTFICAQAIYTATSAGDLQRAKDELAQQRALIDPRRRLDAAHHGVLASLVAGLESRIGYAAELVARAVPVADALGAPFQSATFRLQHAQLLVLDGRHADAGAPLESALAFARSMSSRIVEFQVLLAQAWASLRAGKVDESATRLREALTIGREHGYMNCHPMWVPQMMRELFALALESGIEPEYVRAFIRHRRLAPGRTEVEEWPWPIRIFTLGRFEIHQDGVLLQSTGKAKQRVLDLLKAIIAHGPRGASAESLAELLWPDAEGDAGRDALRVALHRLRKLLGGEHAVQMVDGKMLLNPEWCWVDAFAFERAVDAVDVSARPASNFIRLYKGHFLPAEGERPWLMAERDRLRSKFLRAVEAQGSGLTASGKVDDAIDLYRRATEIDPLAESLYRRLMVCYTKQERRAEAMDAYRRCRQMLSIVLGIKPSAETEALHAALTRESAGPAT